MPDSDPAARLVVFVRHAKAESGEERSDHDRRLTSRGAQDAADTGRWLASRLSRVDHVWVSSAVRAVQTWEALRRSLPEPGEVAVDRALYQAGGREVVERVTGSPYAVQLLVGHNPTFEQAVMTLTGDLHGLRPGAAAIVELAGERGRLLDIWRARG